MMTVRRRATIGDIRIRPLIDTAVCDVEEIEALAFAGSSYAPWGLPDIHDAAHAANPRYQCLIARSELGHTEEVLGWICYRRDVNSATVLRIATHPSSWGKGIGRMMIEAVVRSPPPPGLLQLGGRTLTGIWLNIDDTRTPGFLERVQFSAGGIRYSDSPTRRFHYRFRDGKRES